jgi:hypothetical protein
MLHSKKSELLALYLITLNNADSSKLLSRVENSHFLFPGTQTAFKRFMHILRTKGNHLDWETLCEDPALEESHREILQSFDISRANAVNVDNLIKSLEDYRVGRFFNELAVKINAVEDADSDCDWDSWIFPTIGD